MHNLFTIIAEKHEAPVKPWFSQVNSLTDKILLFFTVGSAPKGAIKGFPILWVCNVQLPNL